MPTFLSKLWMGEITPGSRPTENSPEISKLLALQERHKAKLLSMLTPEQAEIFEKYEAAEKEADCLTNEDAFAEGIRFSIRLFTEALG